MLIHDLVEEPILDNLAQEINQLWRQTSTKEEDLQIKYFDEIWNWKKDAEKHYEKFKLILETRVTRNGPPEYLTKSRKLRQEMG